MTSSLHRRAGQLAVSPSVNTDAMLAYLRQHGWACTRNGMWSGGYECVSPDRREGCGLPLAIERQVTSDLRAAFHKAGMA